MNEAIPVSYRKRRDLRSGTVFSYVWTNRNTGETYEQGAMVVEGHVFGVPADVREQTSKYGISTVGSCAGQEDNDCRVIWEPPTVTLSEPKKPANPKQAYGDKKLATWAVPPALMLGAAKAFGEGAAKYGAFNWRVSKVEAMTYVGAMLRHLAAYVDGEDVDPESTTGKLHLEGIAACVGILLDCQYGGYLIDNRPPKGPAPELVRTPK